MTRRVPRCSPAIIAYAALVGWDRRAHQPEGGAFNIAKCGQFARPNPLVGTCV